MLESLDRNKRDSTLFQFTAKRLRDFLAPNHILIKIDEEFDFGKIVKPLENLYCLDNGRPAIHPEVIIRALLISAVYSITSFRQLCHSINENLAFRWFLFLTIDDGVFDHSTITYFVERIGPEGFRKVLEQLNEELLRLGLLSTRVYADSSLVRANASSGSLEACELKPEEFAQRAREENGLFVLKEVQSGEGEEPPRITVRRYQDSAGKLPISSVDPDARWSKHSRKQKARLFHKDNIIVDKSGFILARGMGHAHLSDIECLTPLLDRLPFIPRSFTADSQYSSGAFRQELWERGIETFIPLQPNQEKAGVIGGGFEYDGNQVVCPQGKTLQLTHYKADREAFRFSASVSDCQGCSQKGTCLSAKGRFKSVSVGRYYSLAKRAHQLKDSAKHRREMKRRQVVVEGVHAHLDQLGWDECKLRGLWKVDCEGYVAALAHNLLKALTKVRWKKRAAQAATTTGTDGQEKADVAAITLLSVQLPRLHVFTGPFNAN